MDGQRFDDLTRALAVRGSRRGFLAGLAGALAAGFATAGRASAACPPEQTERRGMGCVCKSTGRPPEADGSCPCPRGQTRCGDACLDLGRDPDHCGACGAACPDEGPCVTRACRGGVCANRPVADDQAGACPVPQVCCGGACTDRATDLANCGICGNACDDGNLCTIDACLAGSCQNTPVDCTRGVCEVGTCNGTTGDCGYDAAVMAGSECRAAAGPCDVAESCDGASGDCPPDQFRPSDVECRAAGCVNGVVTTSAMCSGSSAECPGEAPVACWPSTCDDAGLACRATCERNSDCAPSGYCNDNGECVPDEALGAPCDFNSACQSGYCVGDVCCQQPCPAPFGATAACADGMTCSWTCDDGYTACGDGCCPNGRTCCDGVCCGEGGECVDGECTEVCRPLGVSCDDAYQCCLTAFTQCWPVHDDEFEEVCCHEVGGPCQEFGHCCLVETEQDPGYAHVGCSPVGICGGEGAGCDANEGCVAGACCDGVCCGIGQACGTDFVCRAAAGAQCANPGECASGLCCGGVCVASNEEHCTACDDICGVGEVCAGACLKDIGQPCASGAECAAGYCYDNVCCDECGGACGRPRPDDTPCGGDPNRFCCGGACREVFPFWDRCGGCNVTCPFGDVCTENHQCTCTESSSCQSGTLDSHRCRGSAGLCVSSTEGNLACIWDTQIDPADTCDTTADCPQNTSRCVASGSEVVCSNDWVCTKSTCYPFGVCAPTLPEGRPIP